MRNQIFGFIMAIIVTGTLAGGLSIAAEIEKVDIPGIRNFSQIEGATGSAGSTVGFGGATQPAAMPRLKSEGFATVINLRLATEEGANVDDSRAAAQEAGLNYIHLPFNPGIQDSGVVEEFIAVIGDKANQPVYIHCGSATRAGGIWMISRVLQDGWEIDAAREETELIALRPSDAVDFATKYIESRRK